MITYAEHEAQYEAARALAVANLACFCRCGHDADVEGLSIVGGPVICRDCRATKGHALTPRAVETYDWDAWEAANPTPEYLEAEEYVRNVGPTAGPRLRRLADLLSGGKRMTEDHVASVLESKTAAIRGDEGLAKRVARTATRMARRGDIDVNRVVIGPDVPEGDYAVLDETGAAVHVAIERPTEGTANGFVIVTFGVGLAEPQQGIQGPQPSRDAERYPNPYSGPYPHLVQAVASNPRAAAALFTQLEGNT